MSAYLLALLLLLAAAFGWVACAVFGALTEHSCRRGQVDFTAAAARGELLHLDWGDARVTSSVPVQVTLPGSAEAKARHLRSVE